MDSTQFVGERVMRCPTCGSTIPLTKAVGSESHTQTEPRVCSDCGAEVTKADVTEQKNRLEKGVLK